MKILIGCESSGIVRSAFRALGHDAWSCDIKPSEDNSPYHLQDDVSYHLNAGWDLGIFHPVCKFLANSGSKHLYIGKNKAGGIDPERMENVRAGAAFFLKCYNAPIKKVCCENPVMHAFARALVGKLDTQFVHPWWFGHMEIKQTGLSLRNLPRLKMTNNVYDEMMKLAYGERAIVHHMGIRKGFDRETERSRTKPGLAAAMADQWSI